MSRYDESDDNSRNSDDDDDRSDHSPNRDHSFKRSYDNSPEESRYSSSKRARRSSDAELRCIVPTKTAGGIIGRKGENIKDMRQTFDARIQLPDGDYHERVLQINASIESCGEIVLRILPIINDDPRRRDRSEERDSDREKPQMIKLLIHQSQAGGVIGVKGYKIKELREKTGAMIKVHQERCPNSTDRICMVSGPPDVVSSCVVNILELLDDTPPKGPIHNYNPANHRYTDSRYGSSDYDGYRSRRYDGGGFNMGRSGRRRSRDRDYRDYGRGSSGGYGSRREHSRY